MGCTFWFRVLSYYQMHFMLWHFWKLTLLVINENIMFDRAKKIINGNKCCKTKIAIKSKSNCLWHAWLEQNCIYLIPIFILDSYHFWHLLLFYWVKVIEYCTVECYCICIIEILSNIFAMLRTFENWSRKFCQLTFLFLFW